MWFLFQRIVIFRVRASNMSEFGFLLAWLGPSTCFVFVIFSQARHSEAALGASRYHVGGEQLRNNHIRMESAGLITSNEITC
jgi:hypothetical protein